MNRELHFEIKQGVAYLRLNRPEQGNAINLALANQLLQAAMRCHHDPEIRCVVLTGTGRFFCVGGDVADFAQADQNISILINELASTLHLAMSSLMRMSKPLLVMVNGITAGAGMGLSLIGDLVIVDEKAKFTPAYSAIGLSPDAGLTWQLPKLVGMRKAQEILLLNQTLSAISALEYGLITEVISSNQLETRVQDLVNQLMTSALPALGQTKQLLWASHQNSWTSHLEYEAEAIANLSSEVTVQERIHAFLDKKRA
ncbi:enoyl-CoA hydratase/isomerase family protein [Acinetobacter kanungonis]|uniref:enoyl-CoA hydratase/isomerase family protein n=1 Tax=Acinetobacter kanungonis TaxID=2699469 RepID=UPI001379A198|nr:enoyl-CoA hydratase/isomerase family protein [Acinetobacter kanungonis]NCI79251.1 enoyl-CoA hydratase/isomerase family protein [Acinetobacter kanungonis]